MKTLSEVIAFSALSVLILSCNRTPDPNEVVNRLPELPPQLAANLTSTKIDNVLMTKDPPPVQKVAVKPLIPIGKSCAKNYVAYVNYPMTVCFPPDAAPLEELTFAKAQADPPGWSPASQPARYYKLSRSGAARLFCRVNGGPWFARVTTTESCDNRINSALAITGAPQFLTVIWSGEIDDVPPPFNPNYFALQGEVCSCCGTQCPDGTCRPNGISCPNPVPQ